jgi:purine-nucleoside phosphorylase
MPFPAFLAAARSLAPRHAVVLGSGLGSVVSRFRIASEVAFAAVPGFAALSVRGHPGRVLVGAWDGVPLLLFQGRMHFYEGNPWDRVTATVRLAAELGVKVLLLTNAAGGIRADLGPGDLMRIRDHIKLVERDSWRAVALRSASRLRGDIYSMRLADRFTDLPAGTYAALTGPSYETPAEIRALAAMGADAVGMSTAVEAEAAAALGLEVAAISCITNRAAGLSAGPLDHADVLRAATAPADRLANLIGRLVVE